MLVNDWMLGACLLLFVLLLTACASTPIPVQTRTEYQQIPADLIRPLTVPDFVGATNGELLEYCASLRQRIQLHNVQQMQPLMQLNAHYHALSQAKRQGAQP